MLLVVDRHSGQPAYRQLMDQIRFQVASGVVRPGDELPSTRALAADLDLNPMTVSKAYSLLEREGVVERRPGRPLVVSERFGGRSDGVDAGAREAELGKALGAAVTAARQLGIEPGRAAEVFERLLSEAEANDE